MPQRSCFLGAPAGEEGENTYLRIVLYLPLFKDGHILFPVPLQGTYACTANEPHSISCSGLNDILEQEEDVGMVAGVKALPGCAHGRC